MQTRFCRYKYVIVGRGHLTCKELETRSILNVVIYKLTNMVYKEFGSDTYVFFIKNY